MCLYVPFLNNPIINVPVFFLFNMLTWNQTDVKQDFKIKLGGEYEKFNFFLTSTLESEFLI